MTNLNIAKDLLINKGLSFVGVSVKDVITDTKIGVAPLVHLLKNGKSLSDFSVADKVIGKAGAMLMVLLEVKEAFGVVMSESGMEVFEKYNIPYSYQYKVEYIKSRDNLGVCPLENCVKSVSDLEVGYKNILATIDILMAKK